MMRGRMTAAILISAAMIATGCASALPPGAQGEAEQTVMAKETQAGGETLPDGTEAPLSLKETGAGSQTAGNGTDNSTADREDAGRENPSGADAAGQAWAGGTDLPENGGIPAVLESETAGKGTENTPVEAAGTAAAFSERDVYVVGNPILSGFLFLKCNISSVKNIEDNLSETVSQDELYDGNYIYWEGDGITYVGHTALNGGLCGIILPAEQFELGCGLRVGMTQEEIDCLSLPFEACAREDYPMDSLYLSDSGCPLNTVDYDTVRLFQFGGLSEGAVPEEMGFMGNRLCIAALIKDNTVVNVFVYLASAG